MHQCYATRADHWYTHVSVYGHLWTNPPGLGVYAGSDEPSLNQLIVLSLGVVC